MPSLKTNPTQSASPLIDIDHLSFSYESSPVLHQVSLQIYSGEFVGMIGPNGGGKTTLLKLIMGFLRPSQGSIRICGESAERATRLIRLAYVPQAIRFDREFPISVEEVVLSGLLSRLSWYGHFYAKDCQAAKEALDHVGLVHLSDAPFGKLSGGQAQRVLIARALVSQPQLLLLDEPTASVDTQAEADIYAIFKNLKGQMTILMVTHNLNAAMGHVDRMFCVRGEIFPLKPEEFCEHFSLGLYHIPLT